MTEENPFAPPSELVEASKPRRKPKARKLALFTPAQIALAALIGAPMAGAWLLAWNYRAFGERSASPVTLSCGLAGTLACVASVWAFPAVAFLLGPFASAVVMSLLAQALQGSDVDRFLERGAKPRPWSLAAGIGVLGFYFILLLIIVATQFFGPAFPRSRLD